jgi:hypothetical protein
VGDIIIVAGGCRLPIILRRYKNASKEDGGPIKGSHMYLFVGCCWLISGELQDLTKVNQVQSVTAETKERIYFRLEGFSKIMYGSLKVDSEGLEIVKEYRIC